MSRALASRIDGKHRIRQLRVPIGMTTVEVWCQGTRQRSIHSLDLAVSFRMLGGHQDVFDVEIGEEVSHLPRSESWTLVAYEPPWDAVPVDDILSEKSEDVIGRCARNGLCFNPLGEIIDCDDSMRILVGCQLEGADVVNTNGVEGSFGRGYGAKKTMTFPGGGFMRLTIDTGKHIIFDTFSQARPPIATCYSCKGLFNTKMAA